MKLARTATLTFMLFLLFLAFVAFAQPALSALRNGPDGFKCGPLAEMELMLRAMYSEEIEGMAPSGGGRYVGLYVSKRGTWTIIETDEAGDACIIRGGNNWYKTGARLWAQERYFR